MKKIILISGIIGLMLTTSSADFSFGKMYEEMKAVATSTADLNISENAVVDKNISSKVTTDKNTVVDNKKESNDNSNSTDINSSNSEVSVDKNVSDENTTEAPTEDNK